MDKEDNKRLVLQAYTNKDNEQTMNVDIKKGTKGEELYRIVLMLVNKMISMREEATGDKDVHNFFSEMETFYKKSYNK